MLMKLQIQMIKNINKIKITKKMIIKNKAKMIIINNKTTKKIMTNSKTKKNNLKKKLKTYDHQIIFNGLT